MTCPVCGTPTVSGARFCFQCGTPLTAPHPTDLETERRVVTVLFGDLSDFTSWAEDLDPERVGVVTDRVLASLAGIVTDFGGHVDKLTGDGIMAVFGAPTAHEDDAERAVRAAAQMQAVVRRLVEQESGGGRRLGLRVGLNTGEVIAGFQASLSYTVVGDAVNTAARLSDVAGVGAVYAGRTTALTTISAASWRALTPLRLKGKRDPVAAYELVGLRPAGSSGLGLGDEAPFLGREREFGALVGRLLDVVEGAGPRAVLVTGEAGVGKTRLAQEVSRFAGELPGARVLWGRVAPYGVGRDLAAVVELVRTACGIVDSDDVDTARERVTRTLSRLGHPSWAGPLSPAVGERLQALLGLTDPEPSATRDRATPGPPVGGDQVRQAVATLFSALAAEAPLLLVLDDLHWASRTMLEGMLDVADQVRGQVLLLALGRPDVIDGVLPEGWWTAIEGADLMVLPPLEESATERLLRAYLGVPAGALDARVRDTLLRRAQGNPFFLAELLHLLVDRGVLRREGERWVLDGPVSDALLPAGVQAVLAARIDGLDGAAKGVLRDASVLGLTTARPALEAVGRASGHGRPEVVEGAVTRLLQRRMLEHDEEGVALRFAHTLVRDVAYAGLAKAERARRHAAAAAHFVLGEGGGTGALRTREADQMAAAHAERAVRLAAEMGPPRTDPSWSARGTAFTALVRLGQGALARDDHLGAEGALARALALDAPVYGEPLPADLVVPARVARAQALVSLHRLDEAEAELVPALSLCQEGERAGALAVLGQVRRRRGDRVGAREAFVQALAAASSTGVDRLAGEALRQLGLLDYFDGRLRDAEGRFRQAQALAERVEDARGSGWALQHLAWSATTRGDYALADAVLEQAADVFATLEDSGGLSWVAGTEGFVRLLQGRLTEARELARSVLPLGEAMGEHWGVAALLVIESLAAAELGDVPTAAAAAELARTRFEDVVDPWGQALALVAAGVAARGAGELERAVALQAQAVELAAEHPVVAGLALVASGYASLDLGDLEAAEGAAWRASALLGGLDLEPHARVGAKVLLAQVLRRRGRLQEALAELDDALQASTEPALLFPRRQALSHRAGTLLDLGRVPEALEAAREAVATQSEDVRSRVLSLRALGAALRASGRPEEGAAALREALDVARSTGQVSEVVPTERLLRGAAT